MKSNGVMLTVLVDDYDRAIDFYVERLGLFDLVANTTITSTERYVCISLKQFVPKFMLHMKKPVNERESKAIGNQAGGHVLLTLPISEAEQLHATYKSRGLSIEDKITELPYGLGFLVTDPFGNQISLFERYVSRFSTD